MVVNQIWRKYLTYKDGRKVLSEDAPEDAKLAYESFNALMRLGCEDGVCSDAKFDKLVARGLVEERLRPRREWFSR